MLFKNDQNIYSRRFGGREIVKKQSVQSISGHPVTYLRFQYVMIKKDPVKINETSWG